MIFPSRTIEQMININKITQTMKRLFSILAITVVLVACGGNANAPKESSNQPAANNGMTNLTDIQAVESTSTKVNTLTQALPTIMVIPSDQCLQNSGYLKTEVVNGKTLYIRDYAGYLLADDNNKLVTRAIQNYFTSIGFHLNDLEQTLKSLNNEAIMDEADGLAKDAKTLLVATCSPDIIIEFDYNTTRKAVSRQERVSTLSYNLAAFDSFSNKSVATAYKSEVETTISDYVSNNLSGDLEGFSSQIKNYFTDLVVNGREISFRVAVSAESMIGLNDEYNDFAESYGDWIREWVKTNAKLGTATLQRNTDKEMYFVNVRITNSASDGTQFNAYDFANNFRKEFSRTFNIKTTNATQGLGDAYVIIK